MNKKQNNKKTSKRTRKAKQDKSTNEAFIEQEKLSSRQFKGYLRRQAQKLVDQKLGFIFAHLH